MSCICNPWRGDLASNNLNTFGSYGQALFGQLFWSYELFTRPNRVMSVIKRNLKNLRFAWFFFVSSKSTPLWLFSGLKIFVCQTTSLSVLTKLHEGRPWIWDILWKQSVSLSEVDNLAYFATIVLSLAKTVFSLLKLTLRLILDWMCIQVEQKNVSQFWNPICKFDDARRIVPRNWRMRIYFVDLTADHDIWSAVLHWEYIPSVILWMWVELHSWFCCLRLARENDLQELHSFGRPLAPPLSIDW